MIKTICTFFLLVNCISFSQDASLNKNKSNFWENVRIGGNLGLSFGNITTVNVSPTAVYDFNEKFSLGASVGYIYNKNSDFRSNGYTASILSIYTPFQNIEFSGELEQLFVNQKIGSLKSSYNYPALYLGIAYTTRNVAIGGRFDVLYNDDESIYTSPFTPFVRVFF